MVKSPQIDLSALTNAKDVQNKLLFAVLMLIIYRLGSYIPLPGIDAQILEVVAKNNNNGLLGVFNMLSGGSLGRMSIFALSIVPYITSSIVFQLLTMISKNLESIKKEGESGRKRINFYTRVATIFLSVVQGYGIAVGLESMQADYSQIVQDPGTFFRITSVVTLSCGTMFLLWIGDQITSRGIGNGVSLIIFAGIVAGLPSALFLLFELARVGSISPILVIAVILLTLSLVTTIIFFEKSTRKIIVQYPRRQVGNKMYAGDTSHMPLKLNTAGVIPPIFANSLLLFPATIAGFAKVGEKGDSFISKVISFIGHGKPLYIVLSFVLILFFSFFYTTAVFNAKETADNLKKYNGFIPGIKPGINTENFFNEMLKKITLIGALYLSFICLVPEIFISNYSLPFYLGGTGMLIVVNVVIDTTVQVQSHLFSHQYDSLLKKTKLKGKK